MFPVSNSFLVLLLVTVAVSQDHERKYERDGNQLKASVLNDDGEWELKASMFFTSLTESTNVTIQLCGDSLCVQWDDAVLEVYTDRCTKVRFTEPAKEKHEATVCFLYNNDEWYGGAERKQQNWPVQSLFINKEPFVTREENSQAVVEPYWLSSSGYSVYVNRTVPLWVDSRNQQSNSLCLTSSAKAPYLPRNTTLLEFEWCEFPDMRQAHQYNLEQHLGKPSGTPDKLMIARPIWSTWAEYRRDINEAVILEFLAEIVGHGFPISQLDIDDLWEPCYGAWSFDENKFPDIRRVTDAIHEAGARATAWVTTFVNKNCEPHFTNQKNEGRFVKDTAGNYLSVWWNGVAASIDFTNDTTVEWWVQRAHALLESSGLDAYKFDAGESGWLPYNGLPILNSTVELYPDHYTSRFAHVVSTFGPIIEARVGRGTQELPMFIRMIDKDSRWGLDNGLKSLVTTLLQMNLAGYPFVLPDMIGGNVYGSDKVSKELFIRWLQANTFMPALQFSVVPWGYDDETISISLKYVALHESYSDVIMAAAQRAVLDGSPINPPVWWIAPTDPETYKINDQFLLGETLLVAPVLEQGAVSRDIYLPAGQWLDLSRGDNTSITGPTWLRQYEAPLDILPYFLKVN